MSVETVRAYVVRRPSGERKNRGTGARASAVPVGAPGRDVSAEADPRSASAAVPTGTAPASAAVPTAAAPASAAVPTATAPHTAGLALVPPVKAVPPPDVAVSGSRIGVIVAAPRPEAATPRWRTVLARLKSPAVRTHVGSAVGVLILAVLLWRLGTGVFLDGLRRIDGGSLVAALGIGVVTTVFSAWRWQLVARGLKIRLPLGPAVAAYYRALFLNAALPGGVLGDVHRAVRHGQSTKDLGRCVRAVVLERVAGQLALAVVGAGVLLTMPSPVLNQARDLAPVLLFALVGALAVVLALRMNRAPARCGRALNEVRAGLLSRRNGPGVALSSLVVLAGHVGMFVLAARVAGSAASVAALLPIAVLALVAMGLPLNVGGWGPREGVTAWAFGAAGLGASSGLAVAVVYGVLSLVASLPGLFVLLARYPRTESPEPTEPSSEVSSEKYGPNESARLSSSVLPFSAEPSEGRPMTPESV
ncbi:flippase-like domain-containing protein [Streptomyces sp. NBC_00028]